MKPYSANTTNSEHTVSRRELHKKMIQRLEQTVEILQKVNCTAAAPLQEKLQEPAKLYNHIFRSKEVTACDKRRAEMKEHIKVAFDESHQRFGANKITAVLSEQGIYASPKYVWGGRWACKA